MKPTTRGKLTIRLYISSMSLDWKTKDQVPIIAIWKFNLVSIVLCTGL
jgi:hypothetical protein